MYYGKEYLRRKLISVKNAVDEKYAYYNMANIRRTRSITIPQNVFEEYRTRLGWCNKAVDLLANRLTVKRFENDSYNMMQMFEQNNSDIFFASAIKGALISGCDFVYLRKEDNNVRMQVVGGRNATGIIDDSTGLLLEGYAVLDRDEHDRPTLEAYFTKEATVFDDLISGESYSVENNTGLCLLVPIINNPQQSIKSFGSSRISLSMRRVQDQAEDILAKLNILSDVNGWPQKWVSGLSEFTEMDEQKATIASMLRFDKDEDGDRPTLGQFTQMSFGDHINTFDTYVSIFAGMSSLTRDDLGFVTENPASAESKKTALESLRVIAGKCQRDFSTGLLNVGYVASCLRDNVAYSRNIINETSVIWHPLVEPDFAALSSIGDGIIKINQSVPNFFDSKLLSDIIGIDGNVEDLEADGLFELEEEDI